MDDIGNKSSNIAAAETKRFLFLQGPITPFFKRMANTLEAAGCECYRVNLCVGDWLFWRDRRSVNYRGKQAQWSAFIQAFLVDKKITTIVLLGEQRFYHKSAIAIAKSMGVDVVVTDFGYLRPDWIVFERNGMSSESEFPKSAEQIQKLAAIAPALEAEQKYSDSFFRQVVWDVAYHISSTLLFFLYPGYRSHQKYHPVWVYLGTGYRLLRRKLFWQRRANHVVKQLTSKRFFVFPLQMQNDFQIRAYSRFAGVDEALEEVIASFAKHACAQTQLLIKVHPLDPALLSWQKITQRLARQYSVSERVSYIDGGSLEAILDSAAGLVTINSTVGLWSLRAQVPTKVLGQSIYDVEGLVDGGTLDDFWQRPSKPAPQLLDDFLRAIAACIHLRGVYYNEPGLSNAVDEACQRLLLGRINRPLSASDELATENFS